MSISLRDINPNTTNILFLTDNSKYQTDMTFFLIGVGDDNIW